MSGLISLNSELFWSSSSWVFNHVMRLTSKHIPEAYPELLWITDIEENPNRHIEFDELSPSEVEVFCDAIKKGYESAKVEGPESFKLPEYFPTFMARYDELLDLIRQVGK